MTVTKLVGLDVKFNRNMYVSHIENPNLNGLRVYGIISPYLLECMVRSVDDTRELQSVRINYQTK